MSSFAGWDYRRYPTRYTRIARTCENSCAPGSSSHLGPIKASAFHPTEDHPAVHPTRPREGEHGGPPHRNVDLRRLPTPLSVSTERWFSKCGHLSMGSHGQGRRVLSSL